MPTLARERPLSLTTPLGKDALLLTGLEGREELSRLFTYELDLVAPVDQPVPFDRVLGQPAVITLAGQPGSPGRYFNGMVSRFSAGGRSATLATYRAEVVPWLWLLTRRAGSRTHQDSTVVEILRGTLQGGPADFALQGTYPPRVSCVQYRESDFDFASRLMEEEGIYYFFTHTADAHRLVVGDTAAPVPDLGMVLYDPTGKREPRIFEWEKSQELDTARITLWDHQFELPHNHLEAEAERLSLPAESQLEVFDYPGYYAQRFDGIDRGGGEQPGELAKIQPEGERVARTRMEEVVAGLVTVSGASTCRSLVPGGSFTLDGHPDANGRYLLTLVSHSARLTGDVRNPTGVEYENTFTCIPAAVTYRPPRRTARPVVPGPQTAVVTGPAREEVFTDKYGRIKVQFHWDREGKNDADSSCWVRVGALHAGQENGFAVVPRVGWEVVVDFLEGDPDQPIVVGSVYDPEHPPPPRQGTP
jgi:type VI secretion system secreted protein VgrG